MDDKPPENANATSPQDKKVGDRISSRGRMTKSPSGKAVNNTPPSNDEAHTRPKRRQSSSPGATPAGRSSSSPRSAKAKRQRRVTQRFEFGQVVQSTSKRGRSETKEMMFDKGSFLAVRADGDSFYMCQANQNVYDHHQNFKIRWLELEKEPDTYRMAYDDIVDVPTVIATVNMRRAGKGLLVLQHGELERVHSLLKAAIKGVDVMSLDVALFQPQPKKTKVEETPTKPKVKAETPKRQPNGNTTTPGGKKKTPARQKTRGKKPSGKKPGLTRSSTMVLKRTGSSPGSLLRKGSLGKKASLRRNATFPKQATLSRQASITNSMAVNRRLLLKKASSLKKQALKGRKKKPKPARPKVDRSDPNRKLIPNNNVTVWEKDPLFESREEVPFVSTDAHSRLVMRAVLLGDKRLLQTVIDDSKQVSNLAMEQSLNNPTTPMMAAMKKENRDIIKLLQEQTEHLTRKPRASSTHSMLRPEGTGRYNPKSLGIKKIRKVQLSRGGKEGNNALTKDLEHRQDADDDNVETFVLRHNKPMPFIKFLLSAGVFTEYSLQSRLYEAVRAGHRKLASEILTFCEKQGDGGFNFVHRNVLEWDGKQDWKDTIREASAKKKPNENRNVLPIHCAAINPNSKYLAKLLTICPEYNIEDNDKRRPIHYAAACSSTEPLQFLIDKGISTDEGDSQGFTPLIVACQTGRAHNAELLLNRAKIQYAEQEEQGLMNPKLLKKFGYGNLNRPLKSSWCPIHFAVLNQHQNVVEVLLKYGADINKHMNATCERLTPLMLASQTGNLDLVKYLCTNKAKIEDRDKFKRTALIHAVRDGAANIVSYLLSRGADPNVADSSGNTALHYAAAYGWYFCLKALLDAGAAPDTPNDWKLTPLAASYMKGHRGISRILMDIPGVNINFQNDQGETLLMITVTTKPLSAEVLEQVRFLVTERGADVTLVDKGGNDAFQLLVCNQPPDEDPHCSLFYNPDPETVKSLRETRKAIEKVSLEIAQILMDAGADVSHGDPKNGMTHVSRILGFDWRLQNHALLKLIIEHTKTLPEVKVKSSGSNFLHIMVKDIGQKKIQEMLRWMLERDLVNGEKGTDVLRRMAKVRDKNHKTPFILACESFRHLSMPNKINQSHMSEEKMAFWNGARDMLAVFMEELDSELHYTYEVETHGDKKTVHESALHIVVGSSEFRDGEVERPAFHMIRKRQPELIDLPAITDGHSLLTKFIRDNDYTMAELMLNSGANVNFKKQNSTQETALLIASSMSSSLISLLLQSGADVKALNQVNGYSCLHNAVGPGTEEILERFQLLLDAGADINALDHQKCSVLHHVANLSSDSADESKDLEQMLIKRGANLFSKDVYRRLPLHYIFHKGRTGRIQSRGSCQFDPVESYSIFASAMKYEHLDDVAYHGQATLHMAAAKGAVVCCMLLIQKGCDINRKDRNGNTPLSLAVMNLHDSCALTLMQKGADINGDIITDPKADVPPASNDKDEEEDNNVTTSRFLYGDSDDEEDDNDEAIQKRRNHLYEILSKLKRKPIWKWKRRHYPTPWKAGSKGHAIFQGIVENGWQGLTFIAMDLLEPFGMDYAAAVEIAIRINKYRFALTLMNKQMDNSKLLVTNPEKQNLLHVMADTGCNSNWDLQEKILLDLLKERGVPLNDQDANGQTALQIALMHNFYDMALFLLEQPGINVTLKDKYRRSTVAALFWNVQPGSSSFNILHKLKDHGAELNALIDYPPVDLVKAEYPPTVDPKQYSMTYEHQVTSLIQVMSLRQYQAVEQFIMLGASLTEPDCKGVTPLMYAARLNDILLATMVLRGKEKLKLPCLQLERSQRRGQVINGTLPPHTPTDENPFEGLPDLSDIPKSPLVAAVDNHGYSVLHHLICSLCGAAYENLELLDLLCHVGAPLKAKDCKGLTPLDHVLKRGACMVARGLQKYMGKPVKDWVSPPVHSIEVSDGITWDTPAPDFKADAAAQKLLQEEKRMEEDWKATPDNRASMSDGIVVDDPEQGIPYDILMTKVDVRLGEYGMYNFYKMQVLYDPDKDMHVLFTCWGRIGDTGQYQRTPFGTQEQTITEFSKIFKAKSGNEWTNVKNFEIQPKKYRLVDTDHRCHVTQPDIHFEMISELPSKLSPYVRDVMLELSSVSMLRNMVCTTGIDIPFGALKQETLMKAKSILEELRPLANQKQDLESSLTSENIDELRNLMEQISSLSSEFYYCIPQKGCEYERLLPLDKEYTIDQHCENIRKLMELEYAGQVLLGAQYRSKELNPLDYVYRAMGMQMEIMDQKDPMVKLIMSYVYSSYDSANIEAIYQVARTGEAQRLADCNLDNHKLLWHGTRTSNLISIFSRGLLVAPKDAPATGYAFGKGVYLADTFDKSTRYCCNDQGGSSKFMLLCETALGKEKPYDKVQYMEEPDEGFNCTRANGSQAPDKRFNAALPMGATIPLGHLDTNEEPQLIYDTDGNYLHHAARCVHYNEYIVYNESQACIRYVVQFR